MRITGTHRVIVLAFVLWGCVADGRTPDASQRAGGAAESATTAASNESRSTVEKLTPAPLPERITCGTQYRPDAETQDDAEESILTIPRSTVLEGEEDEVRFANMTVRVRFVGDVPEGRTVWIDVETPDGRPLAAVLYQVGDTNLAEINFHGGHGFTGLHYIRHAGSLLQISCGATN